MGGHHLSVLGGAFVEKALAIGGREFDCSTLFDEGVVRVKRHVTHPHIVHGLLPDPVDCIPWSFRANNPGFPLCGVEIVKHATTNIAIVSADDWPDVAVPPVHKIGGACRGLHPFCCDPWLRHKGVTLEGVQVHGQWQIGRR
jgi:hypothetical protein